ncbi:MAG: endonuclease domain-containing protein [Sphingobacteriaceae bacterium]|nr:MAG: endonuclease domain-containing protein [Sphingobacteriaceae bacterium]
MRRKIIPYNTGLKELARQLRNDSTLGEILLWNELSGKKLYGYDFQRQKPILNFIADFFCYELELLIEIDGNSHNHEEKFVLDIEREEKLKAYGLTIIRFSETEVRKDMNNVLRAIETYILDYQKNN